MFNRQEENIQRQLIIAEQEMRSLRLESLISQIEKNANNILKTVKVKKLNDNAVIPKYAKQGDSGFDLSSVEEVIIEPNSHKLIKTGLAFELPDNHEIQVRSRSGLGTKGLQAHFGTCDNGYRGELGVILYNHTNKPFKVNIGDRIAQAVVQEVFQFDLVEVSELSETERGDKGYGSTGL